MTLFSIKQIENHINIRMHIFAELITRKSNLYIYLNRTNNEFWHDRNLIVLILIIEPLFWSMKSSSRLFLIDPKSNIENNFRLFVLLNGHKQIRRVHYYYYY